MSLSELIILSIGKISIFIYDMAMNVSAKDFNLIFYSHLKEENQPVLMILM